MGMTLSSELKVSDLAAGALARLLQDGELLLNAHPFVMRIKSNVASLPKDIALTYADFGVLPRDTFADFHVDVLREPGMRGWVAPLARFFFDGQPSFIPLPIAQAFAMLEWGLNWCVASHAHQFLVIHAAVIERNGQAAILPAPPGSGKSTLCAALIQRGWRLLSDELALYDMDTGLVYGMARPVNLKNKSIDVIRTFEPSVFISDRVHDTTKGTIALLRPPPESVRRAREPAQPAWVVLPRYVPSAPASLTRHGKAETVMLMAEQSFNYDIHGRQGFEGMCRLVEGVDCYEFSYSQLADAMRIFDDLSKGISA